MWEYKSLYNCKCAIWWCLRDVLQWDGCPVSCAEFWDRWLINKFKALQNLCLFIFAGFTWAIWNNRNKMAIERVYFPSTRHFYRAKNFGSADVEQPVKWRHDFVPLKEQCFRYWRNLILPSRLVRAGPMVANTPVVLPKKMPCSQRSI